MYTCIIFDVDGTLIDSQKAIIEALKKVLKEEKHSFEYSDEELSFVLGIPGYLALEQLGVRDIKRSLNNWTEYTLLHSRYIRLFPKIENLLKLLRNLGMQTGVVTSNTKKELEDNFLPFGLMDFFDYIVCADDTERHKPNPEPLLKFLELSGANPSGSLYIGDTVYDLECAKGANVDFGLALWAAKPHYELNPKFKFKSPNEILKVIGIEEIENF
ncbi:MAG: HAD-superfamily hydrolase, subfamily variant 1 [Massilibacillus sp.]|jgi:HAD superfamily hydrolase (TIGR01549 family)|nr:HAD-superfamily hydrolase, subfamily variant 1 [Massilibacillus sp.]